MGFLRSGPESDQGKSGRSFGIAATGSAGARFERIHSVVTLGPGRRDSASIRSEPGEPNQRVFGSRT